jgi:hypothetical protein
MAGCMQQFVGNEGVFVCDLTTRADRTAGSKTHDLDMQDDETKDAKLICSGPGKEPGEGLRVAFWKIYSVARCHGNAR